MEIGTLQFRKHESATTHQKIHIGRFKSGKYKTENTNHENTFREKRKIEIGKHKSETYRSGNTNRTNTIRKNTNEENTNQKIQFGKYTSENKNRKILVGKVHIRKY